MVTSLIYLVIYLLVLGLIVWLLLYAVAELAPAPHPLNRIARVAIIVGGCIIAILLLLDFVGVMPLYRVGTLPPAV